MNDRDAKMLIMLTTGPEDGGKRATLAFSAACCAAAMGTRTSVFLVGEGAVWGYVGRASGVQQPGFPPLEELVTDFVDAGGEGLICSACDQVCVTLPTDDRWSPRRARFRPAGMATVLSEMQGASAWTF